MTDLPRLHRLRRLLVGAPILAALFLGALHLPIPTTGNQPLERVLDRVETRLPGWEVARATESWEGSFTVVTSCAGRELAFQLIPDHGLAVGDHWLLVHDGFAQIRLAAVSDHHRYLLWYDDPVRARALSCQQELAQSGRRSVLD